MRGIVDDAGAVEDAQEAEHCRMRSIAYALCDHLLIAGGQLAEPAA
jgi:hypothetical protein